MPEVLRKKTTTMSQSMKPRKVCVIGDTCIVCGFSFVKYEKNANGKEIVHKFYESKMRLNILPGAGR